MILLILILEFQFYLYFIIGLEYFVYAQILFIISGHQTEIFVITGRGVKNIKLALFVSANVDSFG